MFSFSVVFPASKQRPRFYEKEKLTHEEVDGGEEGEELRSAGPEGRTRGGGGEDRCHVKLRHDGGEECRGQIIQALRSGLAGRHFGFGYGFLRIAPDLVVTSHFLYAIGTAGLVGLGAVVECAFIFPTWQIFIGRIT